MDKKDKKRVVAFAILVVFLVILFTTLYFINPKEIVENIGIQNAYLLTFIMSFFGGFSAGGSVTFYATLITFLNAGLNPLILGLIAGIALAIGDIIMLMIASKGVDLLKGKKKTRVRRILEKIRKSSEKSIPFIIFLYMGFSPFPNDILIVSIAAIEYPNKKAYVPMILADLTFGVWVCFLISRGILIFL